MRKSEISSLNDPLKRLKKTWNRRHGTTITKKGSNQPEHPKNWENSLEGSTIFVVWLFRKRFFGIEKLVFHFFFFTKRFDEKFDALISMKIEAYLQMAWKENPFLPFLSLPNYQEKSLREENRFCFTTQKKILQKNKQRKNSMTLIIFKSTVITRVIPTEKAKYRRCLFCLWFLCRNFPLNAFPAVFCKWEDKSTFKWKNHTQQATILNESRQRKVKWNRWEKCFVNDVHWNESLIRGRALIKIHESLWKCGKHWRKLLYLRVMRGFGEI